MRNRTGCCGAARRLALRVRDLLFLAVAIVPPGRPAEAVETGGAEAMVADGTVRPATSDCAFVPSHADPDGRRRREAVSRDTRAFASAHPAASSTAFHPASRLKRVNYVDDEIFGKMEADRVPPAPRSSDAEFLRRVTLDLTGRIPDADTVIAFLADPSSDKRSRMVDMLLTTDAFVDRWTFFYDELVQNTNRSSTGTLWDTANAAYHAYFQDAVRSRKPWDVMARELITASGPNTTVGPANFIVRQFQNNGPPQDTYDNLAVATSRVFLGTGVVFCTSCHNGQGHLDAINLWGSIVKRQDFWSLAAFFSWTDMPFAGPVPNTVYTIGQRRTGNYDYRLNTTTGNKTDRTGAYYTTTPPGLTTISPAYPRTPLNPSPGGILPGETFRQWLARLVTDDPQFARAAVNTLWKEMFKLGIVEPVDGFDPMRQDPASPPPGAWTVQPTHPALLNRLAQDFAAHGYDLRYILGVMAKSNAYQLSSFYPGTWSEAYTPYFARHFARRLGAEELWDAVQKATNVPSNMTVSGSPALALQLPNMGFQNGPDLNGRFMSAFGPGNRDTVPRSWKFSVAQALTMLNNNQVTIRSHDTQDSVVHRLVAANATPEQAVDTLFLKTLSRVPTPAEKAWCLSKAQGTSLPSFAQTLQFVLLQKLDFLYNY
ncbi:MAG TPA: DUF1549 domain-containing protein [Thermoanaerobaculia bacterium]|nr:DUF1549 domain-containing protein [Thermoanaerobaculia bacterium]